MANTERWRQRYVHFQRAFSQLEAGVKQSSYSKLEMSGLIKTFEFTFELGWKTLKDFLEKEGYTVKTPRETIKQAFQSQLIKAGQVWLEALDNRNLMSHTYDEADSKKAVALIKDEYFNLLSTLNERLSREA